MKAAIPDTTILEFFYVQEIKTKPLISFLEKWFKEKGKEPTHGIFETSRIALRDFKSYWYVKNKISSLGNTDLTYLQMIHREPLMQTEGAAEFDHEEQTFSLSYASSSMTLRKDELLKLTKDLLRYMSPSYGACYEINMQEHIGRLQRYGTVANADYGSDKTEGILEWYHRYFSFEEKIYDLKDIYSINFLSKEHLLRKIQNQTLETWIKEKEGRGHLSQFTKELFLWEVENAEVIKESFKRLE